MNRFLELRDLTVYYGSRLALDSVSLALARGSQVAILGPNGAGKSTMFKAMMGLLPVHSGSFLVDGAGGSRHGKRIAYLPQREEVDWRFPVTVRDVVAMGRYGKGTWLRGARSAGDRNLVDSAMERMGIDDLGGNSIGELSGGQQQRVFLARALAQDPEIMLLDEPLTGLDISTREAILQVLASLREQSITVLLSTHDFDLAANRFDQILLLNRRLISMGAPEEVFREENLMEAFCGQMVKINGRTIVVDHCCGAHENEPCGAGGAGDSGLGGSRQ